MPLIRSTIAVAIIFAYSPVHEARLAREAPREAAPARVESIAPAARPPAAMPVATPVAVPLPPDLRPRLDPPDSAPPTSIADLIEATAQDARDAHALWRSLPEDARSDLTRLIARSLTEGDPGENR